MNITIDRDSLCAADDHDSHRQIVSVADDVSLGALMQKIRVERSPRDEQWLQFRKSTIWVAVSKSAVKGNNVIAVITEDGSARFQTGPDRAAAKLLDESQPFIMFECFERTT